jgi:predicted unusual protein kinase regulating ubiquinone biosynthesis (AarF/ABC1/UbiB family)
MGASFENDVVKITTEHLQRYKQIARLLWKYGRSDLVTQMGIDEALEAEERKPVPEEMRGLPEQLADDLEAMGPTYVKLGQVLSSRPDLLPDSYLKALTRLQDKVKPFSYEEVEEIVQADLGVRISKAFSWFDTKPTAAASLGQVHLAALRDGREVVVKVQRPNIVKMIADDFEVLQQIAEFFDAHTEIGKRRRFTHTLEEFRVTINNELNYEREAQNLMTMRENLADFPTIVIPQPIADFCTRRVLTMDYIAGTKITKVSHVALVEMNGPTLAADVFRAYLKQVLVDGLFHADPHPGNVFLTSDCRIALLDLGMVGHITPRMQESLLKVLLAVSEGKAETAADVIVRMSETTADFDAATFERRIGQVIVERHDQALNQMDVGRTLLQVTQTAADVGLYVPSELTLLGKTLLQLDEVGKILDPKFDPNAAIRQSAPEIMSRRMKKTSTRGSLLTTVMEFKDFMAGLPVRLNKIMDAIAESEVEVKVKAVDADLMMEGLQKIANRVTSGLILAAMIVGASLLMRVETSFQIFGYPGLAMLFFLFAAAGGTWLLVNIFVQDQKSSRKTARQR